MRSIIFIFLALLFNFDLIVCFKKKVVIVGGGVSGLAAAATLVQKGITDIAVIEARDRIGGRINTVPYGLNGFIEMGAQWVHGSTNNPIYTFCKSLNFLDEATKTEFGDMKYATQDGMSLSETFVDKMMNRIESLFDAASLESDTLTLNTDKSLQSILDRRFEDLLKTMQLNSTATAWLRAIYDARLKEEKIDTACGNLNELSAIGWNSFSDSGSDQNINLKTGYISVINHFKSIIGEKNIYLNEPVLQIQYPTTSMVNGNPIKIITKNTINGSQILHEADYVLTTFPLGYLKAYYKTLFNPMLPTAKINAIEKLGYGTVNKFWLVFDTAPFGSYGQGVNILWQNNLLFQLDSAERCGFGTNPFFRALGSLEALPKMKNILYGFMAGDDAILTEKISDQCLLDIIYEMLIKVFPKLSIQKPRTLIRSKWNSDGYSKGSYSYIKLGSSTNDIKNLAESLYSRVFFAGEATSHKYITTVHGAYESGIREADKISKLL